MTRAHGIYIFELIRFNLWQLVFPGSNSYTLIPPEEYYTSGTLRGICLLGKIPEELSYTSPQVNCQPMASSP